MNPVCEGWVREISPRQPCQHPGKWLIQRTNVVNRQFCGYHSMKYIRANKGHEFANRLLGADDPLPYKMTLIEKMRWSDIKYFRD